MDALFEILVIGTSATVFIVVFKLAMANFPIPGLKDIAAFL